VANGQNSSDDVPTFQFRGLSTPENSGSGTSAEYRGLSTPENLGSGTHAEYRGLSTPENSGSGTSAEYRGLSTPENSESKTPAEYRGLSTPENSGSGTSAEYRASAPGEPRVTSYTPVGYAPATGGPLIIKKVAHAVETGKGFGNRLRVDVEITSEKKNMNDDAINDIDIYELADESLNIVPPDDDLYKIQGIDHPEGSAELPPGEVPHNLSEMLLINCKKSSSLDEIGPVKLALLRDDPLCAGSSDVYKKIYIIPSLANNVKYDPPIVIEYPIFYWDKIKKFDADDKENEKNLNKLSRYLKDNFGIGWLDSQNVSISYPREAFTITNRRENSESVQFRISTWLSRYLKDNFGIDWLVPQDVDFKYPIYDNGRKESIKITNKKRANESIQFTIYDAGKKEGMALMAVRGGTTNTTYYLKFNTSAKGDIWQVSDWNGIMRFHVESIRSRDRLFYWYYVRPKKSGDFETESIIRINDEDYKGWPDIIYPTNIVVANPDFRFEVTPVLGNSIVFVDNPQYQRWLSRISPSWNRSNIKYLITYTGTASSTYLKEIEVKLDPSPVDCHCFDKDSMFENLNTSKDFSGDKKTISLEKQMSYNNTGTYQIPVLWIEGSPNIFKDTVTVLDPITWFYERINNYYSIIVGFLTILYGRELIARFKDLITFFISIPRRTKRFVIRIISWIKVTETKAEMDEASQLPWVEE